MSPLSAARAALRVYAAGAAVVAAQLLRRCRGGFSEPVFPRQPERVAVVTGGTDGIGYATARYLARLGMHVILAGNNDRKAEEAVRKIKEETLNEKGSWKGPMSQHPAQPHTFISGTDVRKCPQSALS